MRRTTMNRKQFLRSAVTMAGTGVGLAALAACGSDGNKGGSGGSPATGSGGGSGSGSGGSSGGANACDSHEPMETIATNHPVGSQHILTVAASDVSAGAEKVYSIKGMSTHDHMVTITAANFATLKTGAMIMMTSTSGGGHTHAVAVVCA